MQEVKELLLREREVKRQEKEKVEVKRKLDEATKTAAAANKAARQPGQQTIRKLSDPALKAEVHASC